MHLFKIFNSKSEKIYDCYKELADHNYKAAKKLEYVCNNIKDVEKIAKEVSVIERKSDTICHDIYLELNRRFITPMDREDIISLTQSLDDVMDLIHLTTDTLSTYNIKKIKPVAVELAKVIVDSTKVVSTALPKLGSRKTYPAVNKAVLELNSLETKADDLLKKGLKELFKNPKDPLEVIRWRDIYISMEDVTDKTEDIADVLHGLIIKYA